MKFDILKLNADIKFYKNHLNKLESLNIDLDEIDRLKRTVKYMLVIKNSLKTKNRPHKLIYSKSQKRKNEIYNDLNKLLYNNHNLTNQELIEKLKISKANFYNNYSSLAKELREKYKSQSLF